MSAGPSTGDDWDSLLDVEERYLEQGYAAGERHGNAEGWQSGNELGVDKGLELGRELGRFRGRVAVLLAMSKAHADFAPDRMKSALLRLEALLGSITLHDPRDESCFDKLEDARAKMRHVDVWLRGPTGLARFAARSGDASAAPAPPAPRDPGHPASHVDAPPPAVASTLEDLF